MHEDRAGDMPRQRPDRVVGLRETKNLRMLLDQPQRTHPSSDVRKLRDLIRSSPFKWQPDSLLFPFLILEAKTDLTHNNFSDIQYQTAFPIKLLLDLQTDLQSYSSNPNQIPEPLVWFLGYKGSDWKLYGCYSGLDSKSNATYVSTDGTPSNPDISLNINRAFIIFKAGTSQQQMEHYSCFS